jgi:hypothetical protein
MKKFQQKDIFTNTLKTYPKVKIFSSNGRIFYKSVTTNENGPVINDFLLGLSSGDEIPVGTLFVESTPDPLITEDGEYIVIE